MTEPDDGSGISAREALLSALTAAGAAPEPQTPDDYLRLIRLTAQVEQEAGQLLQHAVTSARAAGATWAAVGSTLGMSRQAAQQRFATDAIPSTDQLDPDERILGPVTAFDEMRELALAGRYGWHSVEFGPFYHRVVRSPTQWEHLRVTMRPRRVATLEAQGWQVIGSEFPFTYLKRDLGTPALDEAGR
jgi:hypothetical protein